MCVFPNLKYHFGATRYLSTQVESSQYYAHHMDCSAIDAPHVTVSK